MALEQEMYNNLTIHHRALQMLLRQQGADPRAADIWAAGVVLYTLIGGGFPFLQPEEERLGRAGRMAVMAPHIIAGSPRPLPHQVCLATWCERSEVVVLLGLPLNSLTLSLPKYAQVAAAQSFSAIVLTLPGN